MDPLKQFSYFTQKIFQIVSSGDKDDMQESNVFSVVHNHTVYVHLSTKTYSYSPLTVCKLNQ